MNCARCCNPECGRAGGPWTPGECDKFQDALVEFANLRAEVERLEKRRQYLESYLNMRRGQAEKALAVEVLAGNAAKQDIERNVLSELASLECEMGAYDRAALSAQPAPDAAEKWFCSQCGTLDDDHCGKCHKCGSEAMCSKPAPGEAGHCTCHPGFIGEHGRDCPMRDTPPTNKQEGLT